MCLRALSGSYSKATPAVGHHLACSFPNPWIVCRCVCVCVCVCVFAYVCVGGCECGLFQITSTHLDGICLQLELLHEEKRQNTVMPIVILYIHSLHYNEYTVTCPFRSFTSKISVPKKCFLRLASRDISIRDTEQVSTNHNIQVH